MIIKGHLLNYAPSSSDLPLSQHREDFNILYFTCIEQHHRHSTGDGFVWVLVLCTLHYAWIGWQRRPAQ